MSRKLVASAGAAIVVLGMAGLAIDFVIPAPPNALVYASDTRREFVTPPFLAANPGFAREFARPWTYGAARAARYRAENNCNRENCWWQEGRSLTGKAFESVGVLPKLPSRWNDDGSWNW